MAVLRYGLTTQSLNGVGKFARQLFQTNKPKGRHMSKELDNTLRKMEQAAQVVLNELLDEINEGESK